MRAATGARKEQNMNFEASKSCHEFKLEPLAFAENALEPHISARTLSFHHEKHHQAYVDKLNKLIEGTPMAGQSLEDIVRQTARMPDKKSVFNNAGQHWNHSFFWKCLTPQGGGQPSGRLLQEIEKAFDSFDAFKTAFNKAAVEQFGSGWAWLIWDGQGVKIATTSNADTPIAHDQFPLIACDVWEHAYYLDYQNRRPDFVKTFLDRVANWQFAAQELSRATSARGTSRMAA